MTAVLLTVIVFTGSTQRAQCNQPDSYSIKLEESTNFINKQAKEIESKLVLPKSFPRSQINEEVYLYFKVGQDGEASDFRPLKYDKVWGLTRPQHAVLLSAMAAAVKQVKIKVPRDPVGPPPYWLVFKLSAVTATMNVVIEAPPKLPMPRIVTLTKPSNTRK